MPGIITMCCCDDGGGGPEPTPFLFPIALKAEVYAKRRISLTPAGSDCGVYIVRVEPSKALVRGNCIPYVNPPVPPPSGGCSSKCIINVNSIAYHNSILNRVTVEISLLGGSTFTNGWISDYTNECSGDDIIGPVRYYYVPPSDPLIPCLCFVSFVNCTNVTEYQYTNYFDMPICSNNLGQESDSSLELIWGEPLFNVAQTAHYNILKLNITVVNVTEVPILNNEVDTYNWLTSRNAADITVKLDLNHSGIDIVSTNCPMMDGSFENGCRFPNSIIMNTLWQCYESGVKPDLAVIEEILPEVLTDVPLTKDEGAWTYRHSFMNERITEFSGCPTREQCDNDIPNDCTCYGDDIETGFINPCGVNCNPGDPFSCIPPNTINEQLGTYRFSFTFVESGDDVLCH